MNQLSMEFAKPIANRNSVIFDIILVNFFVTDSGDLSC